MFLIFNNRNKIKKSKSVYFFLLQEFFFPIKKILLYLYQQIESFPTNKKKMKKTPKNLSKLKIFNFNDIDKENLSTPTENKDFQFNVNFFIHFKENKEIECPPTPQKTPILSKKVTTTKKNIKITTPLFTEEEEVNTSTEDLNQYTKNLSISKKKDVKNFDISENYTPMKRKLFNNYESSLSPEKGSSNLFGKKTNESFLEEVRNSMDEEEDDENPLITINTPTTPILKDQSYDDELFGPSQQSPSTPPKFSQSQSQNSPKDEDDNSNQKKPLKYNSKVKYHENIFSPLRNHSNSNSNDVSMESINPYKRRKHDDSENEELLANVDQYYISRYFTDFQEEGTIGSGNFSKVVKVVNNFDGCYYAMKIITKDIYSFHEEGSNLREVMALANLRYCPYIVNYFTSWIENNKLYIQLEYCNGGSLSKWVEKKKPTQKELIKVLFQITTGLNVIHKTMVHLDIKPENLLIDEENGYYKIADLGLVTKSKEKLNITEGDSRYLAKEVLEGIESDLKKADIFSLGCSIYELALSYKLPKNGEEFEEIRKGVIKEKLLKENGFSDEFITLLKLMMHVDYNKRPTSSEILQHKVLEEYDISFEELKQNYILLLRNNNF
jgi:tRNA A-37 threonylcarbamoyl transferase component Bud32